MRARTTRRTAPRSPATARGPAGPWRQRPRVWSSRSANRRSAVPASQRRSCGTFGWTTPTFRNSPDGARPPGPGRSRDQRRERRAREPREAQVSRGPRERDEERGVQSGHEKRRQEDAAERGRAEQLRDVGERVREKRPREAAEDPDGRAKELLEDPRGAEGRHDAGGRARRDPCVEKTHHGEGHRADRGGEREREARDGPRHAAETVHGVGDPGNRHDPEGEPEDETEERRALRPSRRRARRRAGSARRGGEEESRSSENKAPAGRRRRREKRRREIFLEGNRASMRGPALARAPRQSLFGANSSAR